MVGSMTSQNVFGKFCFLQFVQKCNKKFSPLFRLLSDLVRLGYIPGIHHGGGGGMRVGGGSTETLEWDRIRPQRNEVCYFNEVIMAPCAPLWSLLLCGPTRPYVVLCGDLLHFCICARIIKNRNLKSHLPFHGCLAMCFNRENIFIAFLHEL